MVKVDVEQHNYYMDGYLKSNLDLIKDVIKKDWDMIIVVSGYEGSGKSTLAMQCAYYCDPTLDLKRIAFTPREFKKAILDAKQYQSVIYDEAYLGLSSRGAMSELNKTLVSMLTEIRQKNLFVFIVLPSFFDLDKYVALWRSRALINVYTGDNFERGFFSFYNFEKKKDLYVYGKKEYSFNYPNPNFRGRFNPYYVVNQAAYRKKKKDSLEGKEEAAEEDIKRAEQIMWDRVIAMNIPVNQKIKILNLPATTYYDRLQRKEEQKNEVEQSV